MADRSNPCCFRACSRIFRKLQYRQVSGWFNRKRPSEEQGASQQHPVKSLGRLAADGSPIRAVGAHDLRPPSAQVFAQSVIPSAHDLDGRHAALISHLSDQVQGLATGSRRQIQNRLPRLWIE